MSRFAFLISFSSSTESEFIDSIVKNVLEMLQDIPSAQTPNSCTNKPVERGEVSSKTAKSSKKALKVTKGNLVSPPDEFVVGLDGFPVRYGNPETSRRGDSTSMTKNSKPLKPSKKDLYTPEVRLSYGSGFPERRPTYDGFPVRYGNHESVGRGDPSSMTKNSKKPIKPSKEDLEFSDGWVSSGEDI